QPRHHLSQPRHHLSQPRHHHLSSPHPHRRHRHLLCRTLPRALEAVWPPYLPPAAQPQARRRLRRRISPHISTSARGVTRWRFLLSEISFDASPTRPWPTVLSTLSGSPTSVCPEPVR